MMVFISKLLSFLLELIVLDLEAFKVGQRDRYVAILVHLCRAIGFILEPRLRAAGVLPYLGLKA